MTDFIYYLQYFNFDWTLSFIIIPMVLFSLRQADTLSPMATNLLELKEDFKEFKTEYTTKMEILSSMELKHNIEQNNKLDKIIGFFQNIKK